MLLTTRTTNPVSLSRFRHMHSRMQLTIAMPIVASEKGSPSIFDIRNLFAPTLFRPAFSSILRREEESWLPNLGILSRRVRERAVACKNECVGGEES